jgi:hypothetical protein
MKQAVSSPTVIRSISNEELKDLMRDKFPNAQFRGIENWNFILVKKEEIRDYVCDCLASNQMFGEESDREIWTISSFRELEWEKVPVGWAKVGGFQGDFYIFAIGATGEHNEPTILKIGSDGTLTEVSQDARVRYVFVS